MVLLKRTLGTTYLLKGLPMNSLNPKNTGPLIHWVEDKMTFRSLPFQHKSDDACMLRFFPIQMSMVLQI